MRLNVRVVFASLIVVGASLSACGEIPPRTYQPSPDLRLDPDYAVDIISKCLKETARISGAHNIINNTIRVDKLSCQFITESVQNNWSTGASFVGRRKNNFEYKFIDYMTIERSAGLLNDGYWTVVVHCANDKATFAFDFTSEVTAQSLLDALEILRRFNRGESGTSAQRKPVAEKVVRPDEGIRIGQMYCQECGASLSPTAKFCSKCGTKTGK